MTDKLRRFRIPLVIAAAVVVIAALLMGGRLVMERVGQMRVRDDIEAALSKLRPFEQDISVEFYVPYGSLSYVPRNITPENANYSDRNVLSQLLETLEYDEKESRELSGVYCEPTGNIVIKMGNVTIGIDGSDICTVAYGNQRAAFRLGSERRDALLVRGGLPSIEKMEETIEKGLADKLTSFDPATGKPLPK